MLREAEEILIKDKIESDKMLSYEILDGMVDWVRVIDNKGIIVYANKSMEKALGEVVGTRCYTALGKDCICKRCITKTTICTGEIVEKEEYIGDKIYSVKSSPVKDPDDNIYAAVEVFRDVTRERKLEKEIIKKNEKMNMDLYFARTIQKKILPKKGILGSLKIDYLYMPSEMLSGDVFDVYKIDDHHMGIYISDVVGHGIAASIMTMFIRQAMKSIKYDYIDPSEAISELHKRFLDLNLDADKYFTIFYGVLDERNNSFTYVNGGHNCVPLHITNNEIGLLEAKGYPITYLFDHIEYEEKCIQLQRGDKILLYTDGAIEIKNETGDLFGISRLIDVVRSKGENILTDIEKGVNEFKYKELDDDFALLTIELLN